MNSPRRRAERFARYASPPCYAGEVAPDYFDPLGVDPQQAVDVARWRRSERERLCSARRAMPIGLRNEVARELAGYLDALIEGCVGDIVGRVVSGYWPIKGELDLRFWLSTLHQRGVRVALPVVETVAAPLVFREWRPGMHMERGHWNIPVPPSNTSRLWPDVLLAPLVGWAGDGWRLGYGGGYFDRTLAARTPRPFAVGVGLQAARLATIFPQPHDVAMDAIVTEEGRQWMARP